MAERRFYQFPYQGATVEVPIARNVVELRKGIRERVIPGLDRISLHPHSGLAFVRYFYKTDDLMYTSPEATEALTQALRNAGLRLSDTLIEQDPISPGRINMVSAMRQRPEHYIPLKQFTEGTFFIGPMICDPVDIYGRYGGVAYSFTEDHQTSHFKPENSIGVHGETFLADLPETPIDRVTNEYIVNALDQLFSPYRLR